MTVEGFYRDWIKEQPSRVRPHRVKEYRSHFQNHILPARIGSGTFGKLPLSAVTNVHLASLQDRLRAKGLKANTVNGVVHSCLRALFRDARAKRLVSGELYDRAFLKPLPQTDRRSSIDPYTPEERETILEGFREKRPHYFPFVFFQFWTGCRPSEATALRRSDIDLHYARAKIQRSRVQGNEAGTKTARSNREIHLHENVIEILRSRQPLRAKAEDYVFTTQTGAPIDEQNFLNREWHPTLRAKEIRPRPFYNTRHSYASFLFTIGARSGFISMQLGDSIKTLEAHYARDTCRLPMTAVSSWSGRSRKVKP
jgi:integrase